MYRRYSISGLSYLGRGGSNPGPMDGGHKQHALLSLTEVGEIKFSICIFAPYSHHVVSI